MVLSEEKSVLLEGGDAPHTKNASTWVGSSLAQSSTIRDESSCSRLAHSHTFWGL